MAFEEWFSEFIWLDYNEKEGQMHCKVCRDIPNIADKNSSFRRNKSFHVSNIKGHDHSHHHAKCVEAQKAREAPTSTPIRLRLRNHKLMTEEKLVKLFNTAYYIAKNE